MIDVISLLALSLSLSAEASAGLPSAPATCLEKHLSDVGAAFFPLLPSSEVLLVQLLKPTAHFIRIIMRIHQN